MSESPAPQWRLPCPWCVFSIIVNARGQHGRDPGAGVEAAELMKKHVGYRHHRSWAEFLMDEA